MRKILFLLFSLCWVAFQASAQAPKWAEKAKRAVFSVVTYDENNQIKATGNGFFISEEGVALSDYRLFRGAHRAVVLNSEGVQMPVESILGANDMYDVLKFKVAVERKVAALPLAAVAPTVQATAYLLPYSTQKVRSCTQGAVQAIDGVESKYAYFTLGMPLKEKMVSCPVLNAEGQVFALAQKASGQDTASICYGMDARFAADLSIGALSYNDQTLRSIGIRKALPDTEDQALVSLFMASTQLSATEYSALLEDFIAQYPASSEGYLRRATQNLSQAAVLESEADAQQLLKQATADMDKALELASKSDEVRYNRAKLIYGYLIAQPKHTYEPWSFDVALDEIRRAISENPQPVYRQIEGDVLFAKGDYAAAQACYEQVCASEMASAESYYNVVRCKELLQVPQDELLAAMDSCMARFTTPYTEHAAPYLLQRARMRMDASKPRQAIVDYDDYFSAVSGKVNDAFYYYRSQAALKSRQYQRALDDLARAIELNPNELTYRAELAVVNIRVGRNEEAIKELDGAIAIDGSYAEAYRLKGLAYLQMKQKKEAVACWQQALKLGDAQAKELIEKHGK